MKELWVFVGPVSSTKSEGALRTVNRLARHGRRTRLYRPISSRREEEAESYAKTKAGNLFPCHYIRNFGEIFKDLERNETDIIWLDEIHFWEKDREPHLGESYHIVGDQVRALRKDYMIIVSGIGASTNLLPICPSMGYLLQTADMIYSQKADCDWCGGLNIATRSVYTGREEAVEKIKLGGEELFRPACSDCWNILLDPKIKMEALDKLESGKIPVFE